MTQAVIYTKIYHFPICWLTQPLSQSPDDAPDVLPLSISEFTSKATNIPMKAITSLWIAIKDDVWTTSTVEENCESDKKSFCLFSWKHKLSKQFLTPDTRHNNLNKIIVKRL